MSGPNLWPDLYLVSLQAREGKIGRVQVAGCTNATQAGQVAENQRKGSRWFMSRAVKMTQADPEIVTIWQPGT